MSASQAKISGAVPIAVNVMKKQAYAVARGVVVGWDVQTLMAMQQASPITAM